MTTTVPFRTICFALAVVATTAILTTSVQTSPDAQVAQTRAVAPGPGAEPVPLFAQVSATATVRTPAAPGTIRSATLRVSEKALAAGTVLNAEAFIMTLFPDVQFMTLRRRVESRPGGAYTWFGYIPGDELGRAIVTVAGGKLGAFVSHRGRDYTVLPVKGDVYEVAEVETPHWDDSAARRTPFPEDRGGRSDGGTDSGARVAGTGTLDIGGLMRWFDVNAFGRAFDIPTDIVRHDDGSVIDVLVVYSHGAAHLSDLVGWNVHTGPHPPPSALIQRIHGWIDTTNDTFVAGGVATRLNLLLPPFEDDDLFESGSLEDDLHSWWPLLQTLRNDLAADIVVMVTSSEPGNPGASVGPWAAVRPLVAPVVFAHEVGHTLGLEHDWFEAVGNGPAEPYDDGHGYVMLTPGLTSATRSIMSYPTQCTSLGIPGSRCTRVNEWSDSNRLIGFLPFGIALGNPYPADEVAFLNRNRVANANKRNSICRFTSVC